MKMSLPGLKSYRADKIFIRALFHRCAGPGKRIGQTYPSAWRKSLSKRGDQASPAHLGKTARLKGSL